MTSRWVEPAHRLPNHLRGGWLLLLICCGVSGVHAAPLRDGHLTEMVRDVRMSHPGAPPAHPANGSAVGDGSVQTGRESRAEIKFNDQTVLRLGDNTDVRIDASRRSFDLISGAVLTQVPSGVGATILNIGQITATTTGTTLTAEALPKAYLKIIVVDGTSRVCLRTGGLGSDCVLLRAGQMLIAGPTPKSLPDAVDVHLGRLVETSHFITQFGPLPGQDRLTKAAAAQSERKTHGGFADSNLVIFGRGTLVTQPNKPSPTPPANTRPAATPKPSP
ncbi:MAG: FecR domain-containing protein [Chthoniobacterales bacterium]